ncbi:hypothetical protein [Thauera aminoaromatica]|uniref:Uncharacterized protein n=1 Tax=Thauera aminoaromatica TaxID=164330 RepID=A0A5C7S544_THASP|nr:hypothetical protein [Thauera aminoaromatica]TXH78569.1 MAG: hypothetical protein E6Q80_22460 [Thauera aminoaromatica]
MPQKGETAPGIAALRDRAIASTQARIAAFRRLDVATLKREPHLLEPFTSVCSLAAWSDPELGIFPISEKTLRKHLDDAFEGGYQGLRTAVATLTKEADTQSEIETSEQRMRALVAAEAKNESQRATAAALDMTARYLDLLDRVRKMSKVDPIVDRQFKKHLQIFGASHPHVRRVK